MQLIIGIITGLLVLVFLVVIHELGHAIIARRNGVTVKEFGIGFPPRAWAKKLKNGVLFTLNWLPLGGFVQLQGEYDASSKKGDYGAATFWQKTKILLAGVLINWLAAAVIITVLAWVGLPKVIDNQFTVPADSRQVSGPVVLTAIMPNSAAARAGFKVNDTIKRVDGLVISSNQQFIDFTHSHKGQTVQVQYGRNQQTAIKSVRLGTDVTNGIFGSSIGQREFTYATWSAPIVGVGTTLQLTGETFSGLGNLVYNLGRGIVLKFNPNANTQKEANQSFSTVGDSVSGPIGILGTIFPAASEQGPIQLAFLTAIISLSLAVMNVLPIPGLDGGRWFTMAIFRLFKQKLTKQREEKIQTVGVLILFGLIILVTFSDVTKFFK